MSTDAKIAEVAEAVDHYEDASEMVKAPQADMEDDFEFEPMFEERPTEAQLKGEEEDKPKSEGDAVPDSPDGEDKDKPEDDPDTDLPDEAAEKDKPADKPDVEPEKDEPEKDDGPELEKKDDGPGDLKVALKDERERAKAERQGRVNAETRSAQLENRVQELELQVQENAGTDLEDGEEPFKPKTDKEFRELVREDPDAAMIYQRRERRYEQKMVAVKAQDDAEQTVVTDALRKIGEVVTDADVNMNLTDYAVSKGMSKQALSAMTAPGTKIILPGQNTPMVLGGMATELVNFINNSKSGTVDRDTLVKEIEAELRPKIEKEMASNVVNKLKNKESDTPVSLDLPSANEAPDGGSTRDYSESEWAGLPQAEKDKILGK